MSSKRPEESEGQYVFSADGTRWHFIAQPPPVPNPGGSSTRQWRVRPENFFRMGTGKNPKPVDDSRKAAPIYGASAEECAARRDAFLTEYLNSAKRKRTASAPASISTAASARPSRTAAPTSLKEKPLGPQGLKPGQAHAGPGRGRTYEPARPIAEQMAEVEMPLAELARANWLQQAALKKQWQTTRMDELESQIELHLATINAQTATIETQAATIQALRARVAELEAQLQAAARELVSYISSDPILKESSHAQRLESDPAWALIVGLGYRDDQKRSLIYHHLKKLMASLHAVTGGDAKKAKQLGDLLHVRLHAGELRREAVSASAAEAAAHQEATINAAIVASIAAFTQALHDATAKGRYPNKVRAAMQVVGTAVSQAAVLAPSHVSVAAIGEAINLSPKLIQECRARYEAIFDAEWEMLFDTRGAVRADSMDPQWCEHARQFWTNEELTDERGNLYDYVRASERKADEMRDPNDRKSQRRWRIFWLEEKVHVIYDEMVRTGELAFGDKFHFSWPAFLALRPFYVKDATRTTCMCVYHLRWRELAEALFNYRKGLRDDRVSSCSCTWPSSERWLRKQLICEPSSDNGINDIACIQQRCDICKDLKLLFDGTTKGSLCADEMRDHGDAGGDAHMVKVELYETTKYTLKDGSVKDKKDFVSKEIPFSTYKRELCEYWPHFIAHHNDSKWHDTDFSSLKTNLPRGKAAVVIDFAENYSHKPRREHQSKYFSQVQTTIIPVVVMMRVEDITNISEAERTRLVAIFDKHEAPHVVSETHYIISSDMQHDNAMVQKALDDFIIPYLKATAAGLEKIYIRSDGCKAQFKCAANFYWVSRQQSEGCTKGLLAGSARFRSRSLPSSLASNVAQVTRAVCTDCSSELA